MIPRLLRAPSLAILLAGFIPLGCDSGSGSDPVRKPVAPPQDTVGGLIDSTVMPFSVDGANLRTLFPKTVYRICRTDDAKPSVDSSSATIQTRAWSIAGDTLRVDSMIRHVSSWSDDSGKYVTTGRYATWQAYVRLSGAQGLEGSWRYVGKRYLLVAGELEDRDFDPDEDDRKHMQGVVTTTLTFSGGNMVRTVVRKPALELLADWNGNLFPYVIPDSALYEISAEVIDVRHARLTGRATGEVVDIRWTATDVEYSSTDSTHAPHIYSEQPSVCPNKRYPSWWNGFFEKNLR